MRFNCAVDALCEAGVLGCDLCPGDAGGRVCGAGCGCGWGLCGVYNGHDEDVFYKAVGKQGKKAGEDKAEDGCDGFGFCFGGNA